MNKVDWMLESIRFPRGPSMYGILLSTDYVHASSVKSGMTSPLPGCCRVPRLVIREHVVTREEVSIANAKPPSIGLCTRSLQQTKPTPVMSHPYRRNFVTQTACTDEESTFVP